MNRSKFRLTTSYPSASSCSVDRRAKETQALLEEEKANSGRLQDQVNSLTSKIRALKRDKEDAEGEVEAMRSKMRQLRSSLEDAEENSSTLQAQITRMRSAARKTSSRVSARRRRIL